jgi:hypothetical protein
MASRSPWFQDTMARRGCRTSRAGWEIFRDDALPWVAVHSEIPRFAKRPG